MRCSVDVATQYEREQAAACGLCRAFHKIKGKRACLQGIPADEMAKCVHFIAVKRKCSPKGNQKIPRAAPQADHRSIAESYFSI